MVDQQILSIQPCQANTQKYVTRELTENLSKLSLTNCVSIDRSDDRQAWFVHLYVLHCGRDTDSRSFDYITYGMCKTTT